MSASPPSKSPHQAIGRAAFGSLQAEAEPWLPEAFISPSVLEVVRGMQSVVVFGDPGSGKTALYNALFWQSTGPDGYPSRLLVPWTPRVSDDLPEDTAGTAMQVDRIWGDCALVVAQHAVTFSDHWAAAPDWARETLIWFVQRYGQGDLATRTRHLRGQTPQGDAVLDELITRQVPPVFNDGPDFRNVVLELSKALAPLGLDSVWIVADGLERYLGFRGAVLIEVLASFLSTLELYEYSPMFSFKLFVPRELEHPLRERLAEKQRRFVVKYLTWRVPELKEMIEKRLALATGQPGFRLSDLCEAPNLLAVLEAVSGTNPRGWLEQVQLLVDHYLLQEKPQPIDVPTWITLREQNPPRLLIDDRERRVFVGQCEVPPNLLVGKNYDVLRYLYEQCDRIVSTPELYFRAYLGLASEPRSTNDPDYQAPASYDGTMDTLIHRIRQAIEPDPKHPVLLVTVRGRGVQLNVRW